MSRTDHTATMANNGRWKGDNASYAAKHIWFKNNWVRPSYCEHCGKNPPEIKRFEWANTTGVYTRNREDYLNLCTSCHMRMDQGRYCKRGHEFTYENTLLRDGERKNRQCKTCQKLRQKKYKERMALLVKNQNIVK